MATKPQLEVPAGMQPLGRQFELNDVNAFDYLTELLRHAAELKQNPSEDALELLRHAGSAGGARGHVIERTCLAENDRRRPCVG